MKRQIYIDVIKTIAIFQVVLFHCHLFDDNLFITAVISIDCPLFFAINGGLLLSKHRGYKYYVPKIFKILFLILFWGIVSNLLRILIIYPEPYSIKQCLLDVWNLRMGFCHHLWFLKTMVILYMLYPLLERITKEKKTLWISFILISCFTIMGIRSIFKPINPIVGWDYNWALAYAVGGYVLLQIRVKYRWIPFFTFCIAILAQTMYNYHNNYDDKTFAGQLSPFILVATLSLIKFFSMIDWRECAIIKFISANTMGIYLTHWSMSVYVMAQNYTTPFRYLTPILIIIVSSAICWLMNKNKITRTLISMN